MNVCFTFESHLLARKRSQTCSLSRVALAETKRIPMIQDEYFTEKSLFEADWIQQYRTHAPPLGELLPADITSAMAQCLVDNTSLKIFVALSMTCRHFYAWCHFRHVALDSMRSGTVVLISFGFLYRDSDLMKLCTRVLTERESVKPKGSDKQWNSNYGPDLLSFKPRLASSSSLKSLQNVYYSSNAHSSDRFDDHQPTVNLCSPTEFWGGIAGDDKPRVHFPSLTARVDKTSPICVGWSAERYVGKTFKFVLSPYPV